MVRSARRATCVMNPSSPRQKFLLAVILLNLPRAASAPNAMAQCFCREGYPRFSRKDFYDMIMTYAQCKAEDLEMPVRQAFPVS